MPITIAPREHAKAHIDRSIRKALSRTHSRPRDAFLRFLGEVRGRSDLLRPARFRGRVEDAWLDSILGGLLALFVNRKGWLRPVETWGPRETNLIPLFSSLAHHLMAEYPVPAVLLSGWFRGVTCKGRQQQGWFKQAGRGKSLRTAGFPIPLTRRMAHEFAHAPAHYPIDFALRWAQVRGLGGSDSLARAVAGTRLGREFENGEFWISVIHLLVNSPRLDPSHVETIVDYLHDQKFRPRRIIIGEDTEVEVGPPQPGLSIRGRTTASLVRRAVEWQAERRSEQPKRGVIRWARSDIGGYRREGEGGPAWTIRELLDSDELAAEGKAMEHCVVNYAGCCARRLTTIWSVGTETPEGWQRVMTVEVNPASRAVVQAKARCNEEPDDSCLAILKEWAGREGLKMEAEGADQGLGP